MLARAQGTLDWNHCLGPNLPGTQFHVLKIASENGFPAKKEDDLLFLWLTRSSDGERLCM